MPKYHIHTTWGTLDTNTYEYIQTVPYYIPDIILSKRSDIYFGWKGITAGIIAEYYDTYNTREKTSNEAHKKRQSRAFTLELSEPQSVPFWGQTTEISTGLSPNGTAVLNKWVIIVFS